MKLTRIAKANGLKLAAAGMLSLLLVGCNAAQTGALYGAGLGSIIGAATNRHRSGENALIGAGLGALGGYLIGNEVDKSNAGYGNYGYQTYYPQPAQVDVWYQQSYHGSHSHYGHGGGYYGGGYRGNHYGGGRCDW